MSQELETLKEKVLYELSDAGFADKRTPTEAWTQALRAVKRQKRALEAAHEKLKSLGCPKGVLGLVVEP